VIPDLDVPKTALSRYTGRSRWDVANQIARHLADACVGPSPRVRKPLKKRFYVLYRPTHILERVVAKEIPMSLEYVILGFLEVGKTGYDLKKRSSFWKLRLREFAVL